MPDYLLAKVNALQNRIALGFTTFTSGDFKNICLGLELILDANPLDRRANDLLVRLRSDFGLSRQP